jgi:large subunit ribosomal protein L24
MMKKLHVKKGDLVRVIAGGDKGKEGKVVELNIAKNLIKIRGVAIVTKHYKARRQDEKSMIRLQSVISISPWFKSFSI